MKTTNEKKCLYCGSKEWKWETSDVDAPWKEKIYTCRWCVAPESKSSTLAYNPFIPFHNTGIK